MTVKVAVIEYGLGNVKSLCHALNYLGAEVNLTADASEISKSDVIVLPGVGAFEYGMQQLKKRNIDKVLKSEAETGKPLMGICLGMQLLFDESSEFVVSEGLGLISGRVEKLNSHGNFKLPHMGWNSLHLPENLSSWDGTVMEGIDVYKDSFYFVHSYAAKPDNDRDILSVTEYAGKKFCSSVQSENVIGCQFHPEKSAEQGLSVFKSFLALAGNVKG